MGMPTRKAKRVASSGAAAPLIVDLSTSALHVSSGPNCIAALPNVIAATPMLCQGVRLQTAVQGHATSAAGNECVDT